MHIVAVTPTNVATSLRDVESEARSYVSPRRSPPGPRLRETRRRG